MAVNYDDLDHTSIYYRGPEDSEESDGEGGLGNLSRLIVRPPGQSGKAKRGQLCFDAAFECGNLGRADYITEIEYDLFIRPDTCRPRNRFWFNFTVENVKLDQRVLFNVVNLGKDFNLFNTDMTPLVRSSSRQKWQRIPRRLIFYHRSVPHRGRKILTIAFAFDREEDIYHFTLAAPYSFSRCQRHLALWEKKAQAFATREAIAETTQKRRVDLLTIGSFGFKKPDLKEDLVIKGKVAEPKKRVVFIIARAHGGEPPASFICQGFLDYMASNAEKAVALREGVVIEVVPMLNPDGVFLGNQRSDLLGSDLNRSWHRATTYSHPALVAIKDHLTKITAEKSVQLDFILDIHADMSHEGVFVRGNSYDDVYRFERQAVLPKFLAARVEAWQPAYCMFNADSQVAGTARRAIPTGSVDGYSVVASLGGRRLAPRGPYIHYTEDAYAKIGKALAKSLCDYYRHIGVIPPRMGLKNKKKDSRGRRRRRRPIIERDRSEKSDFITATMVINVRGKDRTRLPDPPSYDKPAGETTSATAGCKAASPSSSPERRVVRARVLSPPLPLASPPASRALLPRVSRHTALRTRPRTVPDIDTSALPIITGHAVKTPRLAVVDMSAYIRTPKEYPEGPYKRRMKLARPPRPSHARFTSDEYDTHESDS